MFTTLVESRSRRPKAVAQAFLSLTLHVALGIGAVQATRQIVDPPRPIQTSDDIFVIPARPAPPAPLPATGPVSNGPLPSNPVFVPPPVDPIDGISIPLVGESIDRSRFVVGSPTLPRCSINCVAPDSGSGSVYRETAVDEPAVVVSQPIPTYPPILKEAGIEGRVVVEFVVDTAGGVEAATVRVVESSHGGFERSVREALLGSRFVPSRVHGRVVRQLVRQGMSFKIER